jgi:hypothetical protein
MVWHEISRKIARFNWKNRYFYLLKANSNMKKFTLIAAAFLFTYVANAQDKPHAETATAQQPQTKDIAKTLEFKNADYDFGKIPFGKPAEYEVTIKNISHDSVAIERVNVSCGCTTPKYDAGKKIGPGESYKITLGFNGSTQGTFSKSATLVFSDGMQRAVTFKGETYTTPDNSAPANGAVEKMKTGNK